MVQRMEVVEVVVLVAEEGTERVNADIQRGDKNGS